jgi:hypothetical protein
MKNSTWPQSSHTNIAISSPPVSSSPNSPRMNPQARVPSWKSFLPRKSNRPSQRVQLVSSSDSAPSSAAPCPCSVSSFVPRRVSRTPPPRSRPAAGRHRRLASPPRAASYARSRSSDQAASRGPRPPPSAGQRVRPPEFRACSSMRVLSPGSAAMASSADRRHTKGRG